MNQRLPDPVHLISSCYPASLVYGHLVCPTIKSTGLATAAVSDLVQRDYALQPHLSSHSHSIISLPLLHTGTQYHDPAATRREDIAAFNLVGGAPFGTSNTLFSRAIGRRTDTRYQAGPTLLPPSSAASNGTCGLESRSVPP